MHSIASYKYSYGYTSLFVTHTQAVQISRTLEHWCKHHGILWTVEKLKALKTDYLKFLGQDRSGSPPPKGSFKCVWALPAEKALQLLNIYTTVKFEALHHRQFKKFITVVKGEYTGEPLSQVKINIGSEVVAKAFHLLNRPYESSPIFDHFRSPNKKAPLSVTSKKRSMKERMTTLWETSCSPEDMWKFRPDSDTNFFLYSVIPHLADVFGCSTQFVHDRLMDWRAESGFNHTKPVVCSKTHKVIRESPVVGTVHLIQERGAKLRHIANPFRAWQAVLSPLGDFIGQINKLNAWDCTFDQEEGVRFIEDSLNKGRTVYSIDLSSATDRFPLEVQVDVFRTLLTKLRAVLKLHILTQKKGEKLNGEKSPYNGAEGLLELGIQAGVVNANLDKMEDLLNIFARLSRGRWLVNQAETPGMITSWAVGQPLGLYPSFGIFALTHGLLLNSISREQGFTDGEELTFRVLGDDVVINHCGVANSYLQVIRSMGIEVSPTKTLVSNRVGEFAGRVVGPKGALRVYKFCPSTPSSPSGPLFSLGYPGLSLVTRKYRSLVKTWASMPEPEGLGLNPSGTPLEDRATEDFYRYFFRGRPPKTISDTVVKSDRHWYNVSFWLPRMGKYGELFEQAIHAKADWTLRGLRSLWKRDGLEELAVDHVNEKNRIADETGEPYVYMPRSSRAPRGRPHSDDESEENKTASLRRMRRLVNKLRREQKGKAKS